MVEPKDDGAITHRGPGRVVIGVYAVFAIAATSRALFQLATKFSQAPIAYSLSAIAAIIYIVITVLLWRGTEASLKQARLFIIIDRRCGSGYLELRRSGGIPTCNRVVAFR